MRNSSILSSGTSLNQRGFTIIELMIASAISLLILAGISGLFVASSSSERTNSAASEITTNGRYALEVLRRDLLHAGYRGVTWAPPSAPSTVISAITNECGAGFAVNLQQGIWGSNDTNPYSANCIPSTNYSIGDVLVVRHTAMTTSGIQPVTGAYSGALTATGIYFRSSYERGEVFQGNTIPPFITIPPFYDYALEANAYYVSSFTNSSGETPQVPALKRVSLGATGTNAQPAMNEQLIASNIENIQFQYGRLTTDGNTQFYNANDISTTSIPNQWDDVIAVRVWLLVRASTIEAGYTNTSTYNLGDKTITVNDGYQREVFSMVVQLRNH